MALQQRVDEADRLTTLTVDASGTAADVTSTFVYDTSGQRSASRITTSGGSRDSAYRGPGV